MATSHPASVPTPLASQWDSAVIRSIAYAGLLLLGTVIAELFGLSAENFMAKGGKLIDAFIGFGVVAWPLYLAYAARKNKANPPITQESIDATVKREVSLKKSGDSTPGVMPAEPK